MNWTYADWDDESAYDLATRRSRYYAHKAEVRQRISESYSIGDRTKSSADLRQYLKDLTDEGKLKGFESKKANGRQRVNRVDFLDPSAVE